YIMLTGNKVVKLDKDGYVDNSFNFGTHNLNSGYFYSFWIQNDGVLVGGYFENFDNSGNNHIVKILNNGDLDTTFNVGNKIQGGVYAITQLPNGKIIVGGQFQTYDGIAINIIALNEKGTFNSNIGFTDINSITYIEARTTDQKLFIGGEYKNFNNFNCAGLVKLNDYANVDTNFKPVFSNAEYIEKMALTRDGKLIVSGKYDKAFNEISPLIRLNSDGSRDSTFIPGLSRYSQVYAIKTLDDGKVLLGGQFASNTGENLGFLVRLNQDGSVDHTFTDGTGFNGLVFDIEEDLSGNLLIGGSFSSFQSTDHFGLIRMDQNGTPDNSFTTIFESGTYVWDIELSGNGDIILAGNFYEGGILVNKLVKIKSNGQPVNSFHVDPMPDNSVLTIQETKSGKIYAGGYFSTIGGSPRTGIAKLNGDGSIDNSFNTGTGLREAPLESGIVHTLQLDKDENLFVGGIFNRYNENEYTSVVKLDSTGLPDPKFPVQLFDFPTEISSVLISGEYNLYMGGKIVDKQTNFATAIMKMEYPPKDPSLLIATAISESEIHLSWKDNASTETGFIIERKKASDSDFQLLANLGSNIENYDDANLQPNILYVYRVKAVKSFFESDYSNKDSIYTLLAAPANLSATNPTQHTSNLSWDKVSSAT
ncbi:MAG: fibronectin type III domain-containing protein, partial [Ignavibacteria bacterium]